MILIETRQIENDWNLHMDVMIVGHDGDYGFKSIAYKLADIGVECSEECVKYSFRSWTVIAGSDCSGVRG